MSSPEKPGIDQITAEVKSLIAEIIEVPEEAIREDVAFSDLGADSLMALEIVAGVEKKYRIKISEDELQRVKSFNDVIALVMGHIAAKPTS